MEDEMPKRKRVVKQPIGFSARDVEVLRRAIQAGWPWRLDLRADKMFRTTGLSIRHNIMLSYATGIAAGVCVYLSGEIHPDHETVVMLKDALKDDIAEGERIWGPRFTGKRHPESYFRWGSERTKIDRGNYATKENAP
jgi:hypothetical protein